MSGPGDDAGAAAAGTWAGAWAGIWPAKDDGAAGHTLKMSRAVPVRAFVIGDPRYCPLSPDVLSVS